MNERERRAAYKTDDVTKMSVDQLCYVLITTDGRGEKFKQETLQELLKRMDRGEYHGDRASQTSAYSTLGFG